MFKLDSYIMKELSYSTGPKILADFDTVSVTCKYMCETSVESQVNQPGVSCSLPPLAPPNTLSAAA